MCSMFMKPVIKIKNITFVSLFYNNIGECILYMLLCIKNSLNNIPCYCIFCTMKKILVNLKMQYKNEEEEKS